MKRWQRGEATIERLIAGGELQTVTGAAADGAPWLAKARRTLATAAGAVDTDPDSAFTLAYDAARFACVALLGQQGLRSTTRAESVNQSGTSSGTNLTGSAAYDDSAMTSNTPSRQVHLSPHRTHTPRSRWLTSSPMPLNSSCLILAYSATPSDRRQETQVSAPEHTN
jgi:hypothetical protein